MYLRFNHYTTKIFLALARRELQKNAYFPEINHFCL